MNLHAALRISRQKCATRPLAKLTRGLSSGPTSSNARLLPWFIDPADKPTVYSDRELPPHLQTIQSTPTATYPPFPAEIPTSSPLARLHEALLSSPHLEPGTLLVREPIQTDAGPPLPHSFPKGRRRRGGTYFGEGLNLGDAVETGGIWSWIVIAQVKDGTENRGAIESVMRLVRKTLLTDSPPVVLPPNSKRKVLDGWAMLDAGEFAVHIVGREARQKYFPTKRSFVNL